MVDTNDLVDSSEVAEILGLSSARAVSVYRSRYEDFPQPIVVKASGRLLLWRRSDAVAWASRRSGP